MASKRRCLSKLAGTKYVTDSALSSVLQKLADAEVDLRSLPIGRRSISRAVAADVAVPTEHGPDIQCVLRIFAGHRCSNFIVNLP